MRKLKFTATNALLEYHNPKLSFLPNEVKEISADMADYLEKTFPGNFTKHIEGNGNQEFDDEESEGQVPALTGDPLADDKFNSGDPVYAAGEEEPVTYVDPEDPAEEPEDEDLGKPEQVAEEVKTSADNTAPKRTNQRKRSSGVPKTKLFGK